MNRQDNKSRNFYSSFFKTGDKTNYIENFVPPRYEPNRKEIEEGSICNMGTANVAQICPKKSIMLRNEWEVTPGMNTGKVLGGFDKYNIRDIPSCSDRDQEYMNFMDFTKPWNRVMSKRYEYIETIYNSHGTNSI